MAKDDVINVSLKLPWKQGLSIVTIAADNFMKVSLWDNSDIAETRLKNFLD